MLPLTAALTEFYPVEIALRNILQPKGKPGQDYEYIYALGDIIDRVLDLDLLDTLSFQPNRDTPGAALLIRIK